MKIIEIEIENTQLAELGIEQSKNYTKFYFNPNQLIGYWIDSVDKTITFYVGAQVFICENSQANRSLLNTILIDTL